MNVKKKLSFWKKHIIPGKARSKVSEDVNGKLESASFQNYETSVKDAWDIKTSDSILLSASSEISTEISESAAQEVLSKHEQNLESIPSDSSVNDSRLVDHTMCKKSDKKRCGNRIIITNPQKLWMIPPESTEENFCKLNKFQNLLSTCSNLEELCESSWSGIPDRFRGQTWRLLSGYLPMNPDRRNGNLERKRKEYWQLVDKYYYVDLETAHRDTRRQISIDVPRMNPLVPLLQQKNVQLMFERILFIWAIRHPASGYVQGINDLVTPFYVVFLQEFMGEGHSFETFDVETLSKDQRDILEADTFWCLSKFLSGIQDNYVFAQVGIQRKVHQLEELIRRVDYTLHKHLKKYEVSYIQFSFRWLNNLLTREIPLRCSIRLWDTYLAENDCFPIFQLYVCAAFLLHWKDTLMNMKDFPSLLLFLQNLPTRNWKNSDINVIVAEAYRLKFIFADAPNHLIYTASDDLQ